MKKILFVLVGGLLLTTTACKKGENDPGLSLSTRKARLAGEYKIESWSNEYTNVYSNGDKEEVSLIIEGTTGTRVGKYTPNGEATTTTTNQSITVQAATFTFDKDGTWSAKFNRTTTWTEEGDWLVDHYDYTQVQTTNETGTWSFLPGQGDDFKNKERVFLSVLNSVNTSKLDQVTTYIDDTNFTSEGALQSTTLENANGEVSVVYEIDMLKGKEMVFVQDLDGNTINQSTTGGITYTSSAAQTGQIIIRLAE